MSALYDQVQKQARMLTPQEKAALAHQLIQELDSSFTIDAMIFWKVRFIEKRRAEGEPPRQNADHTNLVIDTSRL